MRVALHSTRPDGLDRSALVRRLGVIGLLATLAAFGTQGTAQAEPAWKNFGPAFQAAESSSGCTNQVSPTTDTYTCSHTATVDAVTGAGTGSAAVDSPYGQNYPMAWAQSHVRATDRREHPAPSISYTAVVHVNAAQSQAQTGPTGAWTWSTFDIVLQARHSSCAACSASKLTRVAGPGDEVKDREYSVVLTVENPNDVLVPAGDIALQVTTQCVASVLTRLTESASASCSYDAVVTSLRRN